MRGSLATTESRLRPGSTSSCSSSFVPASSWEGGSVVDVVVPGVEMVVVVLPHEGLGTPPPQMIPWVKRHTSPMVQGLPSSHGAPITPKCWHDPSPSHWSAVHSSPSSAHDCETGSAWHVGEQQSPAMVLPSSQASPAVTIPFPQPVGVQLMSQPSPDSKLPSSHPSPTPATPSPQPEASIRASANAPAAKEADESSDAPPTTSRPSDWSRAARAVSSTPRS